MKIPALALSLSIPAMLLLSGCVHHEKTVYQDTERMPVSFENETAGRVFYEALSKARGSAKDESSTQVSLPIVFHHKVRTVRGPNTDFNNAVLRCDTNRDGTISEQEAAIFAAQVK